MYTLTGVEAGIETRTHHCFFARDSCVRSDAIAIVRGHVVLEFTHPHGVKDVKGSATILLAGSPGRL